MNKLDEKTKRNVNEIMDTAVTIERNISVASEADSSMVVASLHPMSDVNIQLSRIAVLNKNISMKAGMITMANA